MRWQLQRAGVTELESEPMGTKEKVDKAFEKHGPRLTTVQIVELTGCYTSVVRHYLKPPEYQKVGVVPGKSLAVWERVDKESGD